MIWLGMRELKGIVMSGTQLTMQESKRRSGRRVSLSLLIVRINSSKVLTMIRDLE